MGALYRSALESVRVVESLDSVDPQEWNALAGGQPFVRHEFLSALIDTGCAAAASGWTPQFLLVRRAGALVAAMPLFAKSHSYGEYVFDWAWADAHERHGIAYYPKLLAAVPFTPATGSRLLCRDAATRGVLARALVDLARGSPVSSLHVLFPLEEEAQALREAGMLERRGVQFHWRNPGYPTFDAFLAELSHDKRKKIRQERRRVADTGVTFRRLTGREATGRDWDFFNRCYRRTYALHRSTPYLNRAFFGMIAERMPDNLLLVLAERDGHAIAARSEEHTSELQSQSNLVCRLLLE